jgi:hypothetical protein
LWHFGYSLDNLWITVQHTCPERETLELAGSNLFG